MSYSILSHSLKYQECLEDSCFFKYNLCWVSGLTADHSTF